MNNNIQRKIYVFWTNGDLSTLTPNRINSLNMIKRNINVDIQFLDKNAIEEKILPEYPLHPGYKFLSYIHKSDYLRSYFMHFYGGGYCDLKPYGCNNNWSECFEHINNNPDLWIIGVKEIIKGSPIPKYRNVKCAEKLLSNGFFICKPQTPFTQKWYDNVQKEMDRVYPLLEKNPADCSRKGGEKYPIHWSQLQGNIFHPIVFNLPLNRKSNILNLDWKKDIPYL